MLPLLLNHVLHTPTLPVGIAQVSAVLYINVCVKVYCAYMLLSKYSFKPIIFDLATSFLMMFTFCSR